MNEPTTTDLLQAIYDLGQRMERGFADLKAEVAEIRGRLNDAPTARDFGRLGGRVAEMSERLPTTIGYNPRAGKKSA